MRHDWEIKGHLACKKSAAISFGRPSFLRVLNYWMANLTKLFVGQ